MNQKSNSGIEPDSLQQFGRHNKLSFLLIAVVALKRKRERERCRLLCLSAQQQLWRRRAATLRFDKLFANSKNELFQQKMTKLKGFSLVLIVFNFHHPHCKNSFVGLFTSDMTVYFVFLALITILTDLFNLTYCFVYFFRQKVHQEKEECLFSE